MKTGNQELTCLLHKPRLTTTRMFDRRSDFATNQNYNIKKETEISELRRSIRGRLYLSFQLFF